jgi:hypothetical protein
MRVPNHICELSKPSNPVNLKLDQSAIEKDMQDYRSLPQNPVIQTGGDLLN